MPQTRGSADGLARLKLFTNIPNPYNRHLYAALRAEGVEVSVAFASLPSRVGRAWPVEADERDQAAQGVLAEVRTLLRSRTQTGAQSIVLSGNYTTGHDVVRRLGAAAAGQPLWFWGERLKECGPWLHAYRRLYFAGMTGVLAIGTWAVPGYRRVVSRSTPIHVFPYTTSAENRPGRRLSERPTVGFVGQLVERKGLDQLLHGLARIPALRRPLLEVVGSGPNEARLRDLASRSQIEAVWHGEVRPDRVDDLRSRWWFQAVPSRYDGWGLVVAEAMAVGLPVLASRSVGAALDLIRPGFNGELVASDRHWTEAIDRYLDRDRVLCSGEAARRVGEAFSARQAASWLTEVLAPGRGTSERSFAADAWRQIDGAS